MKRLALLLVSIAATAGMVFAQGTLSPAANFTLRDADANGTADLMDAEPDRNWFDGLLTVNVPNQEDRHHAEFNMSLRPVPWNFTGLTFTTDFTGGNFPPSTLRISSYIGNGSPDLSDWTIATTPLATIPGITRDGGQTFTVDVTSLANSFGNSGFLGFRFELLDSQASQKILRTSSIALTPVPEPSSALLALLGLGLGGCVATRCRCRK
jgi:hypothetical protein